MAIKFNVGLKLAGVDVPPGAIGIIQFTSPFTSYSKNQDGSLVPNYDAFFALQTFKDLTTYKTNQNSYFRQAFDELPSSGIMSLTKVEAQALTAVQAEINIKDWCESFLGEGTCEIIDLFP